MNLSGSASSSAARARRALAPIVLACVLPLSCAAPVTAAGPATPTPLMMEPLVPMPPPSPLAALASTTTILAAQLGDVACPPPGLPPELAAKVDCGAMRPFADAVAWVPRRVDPAMLPATVDLRAHGLVGPVKDQLQVGACAGFAMSTVLDNAGRRLGWTQTVSPLHVFATYAPTGQDFSTVVKGRAFTTEPAWPFDPVRACRFARDHMGHYCQSEYGVTPGSVMETPWVLAERDRADAQGTLRVLGYEEMPRDPNEWVVVLASGEAMWIVFEFHDGAWSGLRDSGATHLPWYPRDPNAIPHAVTLVGYRSTPRGREFLIQNSWGPRWASGGFAWVSEAVAVEKFMYGYRVLAAPATVPAAPATGAPSFDDALGPLLKALPASLPFGVPQLPPSLPTLTLPP